MTEPLDLRPLDVQLDRLVNALSGTSLAPRLLREGGDVAEEWAARVRRAALVDTGDYAGTLHARRIAAGKKRANVAVEVGREVYYARFQEYGTRSVRATPVGRETFGRKKDEVVDGMRDEVEAIVRRVTGAL